MNTISCKSNFVCFFHFWIKNAFLLNLCVEKNTAAYFLNKNKSQYWSCQLRILGIS